MIHIIEKCMHSLDQEPGGPLCVQFKYRVAQSSLPNMLKLKNGKAAVELLSDNRLEKKQIAEFFGIDIDQFSIQSDQWPPASTDNPVPG